MTDDRRFRLTQALDAVSDYRDLLLRLGEATDQLLAAAERRDVEAIENLIQARSSLCEEIARSAHALESAMDGINPRDDSAFHEELRVMQEQVETSEAELVRKQAECEHAMSAGLRACRSELANLSRRRGLPDAYLQIVSEQDARFLDSRL